MFVVLMIPRLRHRHAVALLMPTISTHLSSAIAVAYFEEPCMNAETCGSEIYHEGQRKAEGVT
jgi:hypothetical protein